MTGHSYRWMLFCLLGLCALGCSEKYPETLSSLFFGSPTASGALAPETPVYVAPANNASNQPTNPILQWSCIDDDSEFLDYYIYLGTDGDAYLYDSVSVATSFQLENLSSFTTYYWGIVARDESGHQAQGPVWSFTTGN